MSDTTHQCIARVPGEDVGQATCREALASKLIDIWIQNNNQRIPWKKCISIIAIVTKMDPAEEQRLLNME